MKRWLLRFAVVLSLLACLATGAWWVWKEWYAAEQLQAAVMADDVRQVRVLVQLGAPVETDFIHEAPSKKYKGKPLHRAAIRGNSDIVKLLLAHGAKVDSKDNFDVTPLHLAALWDRSDVAKLLLTHGADPYVKDIDGNTPLDLWPELTDIVKEVEAKKKENK